MYPFGRLSSDSSSRGRRLTWEARKLLIRRENGCLALGRMSGGKREIFSVWEEGTSQLEYIILENLCTLADWRRRGDIERRI